MYQDTNRIRARRVAINLDRYEAQLIDALVDYTGLPRAIVLRKLAMDGARLLLLGSEPSLPMRAPQNEARLSAE